MSPGTTHILGQAQRQYLLLMDTIMKLHFQILPTHTIVGIAADPMSFNFTSITIDSGGVATVTHASTGVARLYAGDTVSLSGFGVAVNGVQTIKSGTTPHPDTSFQFVTTAGAATENSGSGQSVVSVPCSHGRQ